MNQKIKNSKKFRLLPPSLLASINVSIGNESKHLNTEKLISLFNKKVGDYNITDKYAVEMIQTEVSKKSIIAFMKKYNIPKTTGKYVKQNKLDNNQTAYQSGTDESKWNHSQRIR